MNIRCNYIGADQSVRDLQSRALQGHTKDLEAAALFYICGIFKETWYKFSSVEGIRQMYASDEMIC